MFRYRKFRFPRQVARTKIHVRAFSTLRIGLSLSERERERERLFFVMLYPRLDPGAYPMPSKGATGPPHRSKMSPRRAPDIKSGFPT